MTTSTETAGSDPAGGNGADTSAAAGTQPNGQTSQPAPWYSTAAGFTDDDKAYVENKGWKEGPQNVLKSYRELERVMGDKANAVLLPRAGDPDSTKQFFQQHFGTPEKADDYKMPEIPQDQMHLNDGSIQVIRQLAHAANATPQQFAEAVKIYNDQIGAAKEADVDRYNGEVAQVASKLEQEFGNQYGEQVARGNLAMNKLGLQAEDVTGISEAIGIEKATRLLMNIGGMLAQDTSVGMNSQGTKGGFVTDKARAAERISAIKRGDDPNFQKALMDPRNPEHQRVSAQWREWQRVANS